MEKAKQAKNNVRIVCFESGDGAISKHHELKRESPPVDRALFKDFRKLDNLHGRYESAVSSIRLDVSIFDTKATKLRSLYMESSVIIINNNIKYT